jgi:hypothetical protein
MNDVEKALLMFVLLRDELTLPPDIAKVIDVYQSTLRIPISCLQLLSDDDIERIYITCQEPKLREALLNPARALHWLAAVGLEGLGEALQPYDPKFYLLCLCVSRLCLTHAHFDIAWALAYAFETMPRGPYPIKLIELGYSKLSLDSLFCAEETDADVAAEVAPPPPTHPASSKNFDNCA